MNVTEIVNPFWDAVQSAVVDGKIGRFPDYRLVQYMDAKTIESLYERREKCCRLYTWAIPDPLSVAFVQEWIGVRGVEMGAGTGYWSSLLAQSGVDMLCYDIAPPDKVTDNHYHSPRESRYGRYTGEIRHVYHPISQGTPEILAEHSDRTLFLCWPPYDTDMAFRSLRAYTGNRMVFIGEGQGGCTGDDAFFALLTEDWHEVAYHKCIQWDGIHDDITVYERGADVSDGDKEDEESNCV